MVRRNLARVPAFNVIFALKVLFLSLKACCKTLCWSCRSGVRGYGLLEGTGSDRWDLSEVSGRYLSVSNALGLALLDVPRNPVTTPADPERTQLWDEESLCD